MRRAIVSAFIALMLLSGVPAQAAGGSSAFTGAPVESKSWSHLCLERERDPGYQIGVIDSPFRELCPQLKQIKSSPGTTACFRDCSAAKSHCLSAAGGDLEETFACLDFGQSCDLWCRKATAIH